MKGFIRLSTVKYSSTADAIAELENIHTWVGEWRQVATLEGQK